MEIVCKVVLICTLICLIEIGKVVEANGANSNVLVHTPRTIWNGEPFRASISLSSSATHEARVELKIRNKDFSFVAIRQENLFPGDSKILELNETIKYFNLVDEYLITNVTVVDLFSNALWFSRNATIYRRNAPPLFYIQTDKSRYGPGETVQFRAIVTTHNQFPYHGDVKRNVRSENRGVVATSRSNTKNGILQGRFKFPERAKDEKYFIEFTAMETNTTSSVCVEVSSAKKRNVVISLDAEIKSGNDDRAMVKGIMKARYLNGMPFAGSANIELITREISPPEIKEISSMKMIANFKGEYEFSYTADELKELLCPYCGQIYVNANVSKTTNKESVATHTSIVQYPESDDYLYTEVISMSPRTITPGLQYSVQVKVQKSSTNEAVSNMALVLHMQYKHSLDASKVVADRLINGYSGPDGMATFEVMTEYEILYDYVNMWIDVLNRKNSKCAWYVLVDKSPSKTRINLRINDTDLYPGKTVEILLSSNYPLSEYTLQFLSSRNILRSVQLSSPSYEFNITTNMVPLLTITATLIKKKSSEVVTDVLKVPVRNVYVKTPAIILPFDVMDVTDEIDVSVNATPGEYLGIWTTRNDESTDFISDKLISKQNDRYESIKPGYVSYIPWKSGMLNNSISTAWIHLVNAGLLLLTNAEKFKDPTGNIKKNKVSIYDYESLAPVFQQNMEKSYNFVSQFYTVAPIKYSVLNNGPYMYNMWQRDEALVNESGIATFRMTFSESGIWKIHVYAISNNTGLLVSTAPAKINVRENYTLHFDLPQTIIKDEILILKVSTASYVKENSKIVIRLSDGNLFQLLDINNKTSAKFQNELNLHHYEVKEIVYLMKFNQTGRIPINITLSSKYGSTTKSKSINVEAHGIRKRDVKNAYIQKHRRRSVLPASFPVVLTEQPVNGFAHLILKTNDNYYSNILNQYKSKPTAGCGFNKLVLYVANLLQYQHIQSNNERGLLLERLQTLYAELILYQHESGLFSVFMNGKGDGEFTSYALKWLLYAKEINNDLVSDVIIKKILFAVLSTQNRIGMFVTNSNPKLNHEFVGQKIPSRILYSQYKTKKYLESQFHHISDPYTLSIVTYALKLTDSKRTMQALYKLEKMSKRKGNMQYWKVQSPCDAGDHGLNIKSLETTSYVLLSYLRYNHLYTHKAKRILSFLIHQRNLLTDRSISKNTLVIFQALTEGSRLIPNNYRNINVHLLEYNNEQLLTENAFELDNYRTKRNTNSIDMRLTGVGNLDMQLAIDYIVSIPVMQHTDDRFNVSAISTNVERGSATLTVCISRNATNECESYITVAEVNVPNGFAFEKLSTDGNNEHIMQMNIQNNVAKIYINQESLQPQCFELHMRQYVQVINMRPKIVKVYDYENPDFATYVEYLIPNLISSVCSECDFITTKLNAIASPDQVCYLINGEYSQQFVPINKGDGIVLYHRKYGLCTLNASANLNNLKEFTIYFKFLNAINNDSYNLFHGKINNLIINVRKFQRSEMLEIIYKNTANKQVCTIYQKVNKFGLSSVILQWDGDKDVRAWIDGRPQLYNVCKKSMYFFPRSYSFGNIQFKFGEKDLNNTEQESPLFDEFKLWSQMLSPKEVQEVIS